MSLVICVEKVYADNAVGDGTVTVSELKEWLFSTACLVRFRQAHDSGEEARLRMKATCLPQTFEFRFEEALKPEEMIEFECFVDTHEKLPFGVYSMLCESLTSNHACIVDDFLCDPMSNKLLKTKILFTVNFNPNGSDLANRAILSDDSDNISNRILKALYKINNTMPHNASENKAVLSEIPTKIHKTAKKRRLFKKPKTKLADRTQPTQTFVQHMPFDMKIFKALKRRDSLPTNRLRSQRSTSWLVRVNIIELKYIAAHDGSVYLTVQIGDRIFRTSSKSCGQLQFNELFKYEIENMETMKLYFHRYIGADICVGSFQIDFGTVYREPRHEFYHKWGRIISVDKNTSTLLSPKGYVKCDLIVQTKGDKVPLHSLEEEYEEDEVDRNLILPHGTQQQTVIDLVINVKSAVLLHKEQPETYLQAFARKMFPDRARSEHTIVPMEENDAATYNPFFKVTFGSITKQTSVKKSTNSPIWNESLRFATFFPALVSQIKFELCSLENNGFERVLSTEFLDINSISDCRYEYTLPYLSPCHVDMYTEPAKVRHFEHDPSMHFLSHSYRVHNQLQPGVKTAGYEYVNYEDTNSNSSYVARVALGIKSSQSRKLEGADGAGGMFCAKESVKVKESVSEFVAFAMISEVSQIDPGYRSKLSFRLCVGTNGYENWNISNNSGESSDNCTKAGNALRLSPSSPYFLPFAKIKPALSITFSNHDLRSNMYRNNRIRSTLRSILSAGKSLLQATPAQFTEYRLSLYQLQWSLERECLGNSSHFTNIELSRTKKIISEFKVIIESLRFLSNTKDEKRGANLILESIERIEDLLSQPMLNFFPDMHLWLMSDGQPVGICNIKAADAIWSEDSSQRGLICKQFTYLNIKPLSGASKYHNIGRVRLYVWLGLQEQTDCILEGLEDGFGLSELHVNQLKLPTYMFYRDKHVFELRAHVYQGRNLLGLDSSGLSDPFINITIGSQSVKSETVIQTNNPKWKLTFLISDIYLYGDLEFILNHPPQMTIELFDEDFGKSYELMGRCYTKPSTRNFPSHLSWHKLYNHNNQVGDILASFDLVHSINRPKQLDMRSPSDEDLYKAIKERCQQCEPIPHNILPKTKFYMLEILFWGLRDLRNVRKLSVARERFTVIIEIGDKAFTSTPIETSRNSDNFKSSRFKSEIKLPELDEYKPHMSIRCEYQDIYTDLNRKCVLIGSYTVESIGNYYKSCEDLKSTYARYLNSTYRQRMSSWSSSVGKYDLAQPNVDSGHATEMAPLIQRQKFQQVKTKVIDWWSKYEVAKQKQKQIIIDRAKRLDSSDPEIPKTPDYETTTTTAHSLTMGTNTASADPLLIGEVEIFASELEKTRHFRRMFSVVDTFPLYKGKNQSTQAATDSEVQCHFKGQFMLYENGEALQDNFSTVLNRNDGSFFCLKPPNAPVRVMLHIYVVKATIFGSLNERESCYSYLSYKLGGKWTYDSEKQALNTLSPVFGKVFSVEIEFPYESQLVIALNHEGIIGLNDQMIGQTFIDLEDRFYSKAYATCGIAKEYEETGPNAWRDSKTPSRILSKLCLECRFPSPVYRLDINELYIEKPNCGSKDKDDGSVKFCYKLAGECSELTSRVVKEKLALKALNDWKNITGEFGLVPEHIETRSLYCPNNPDMEYGKVEMWIDMFTMDGQPLPKQVNISPRKPERYQLRVIVRNVEDVILSDYNPVTGEQTSDIYVRGFMVNEQLCPPQKTDVHYRSLDGEGNFNWRFVFDIEYLPAEEMIVYYQKTGMLSSRTRSIKEKPILNLQCWDADSLMDDKLGILELNLVDMMKGSSRAIKCKLAHFDRKERQSFSLFDVPKCAGWWPFLTCDGKEKLAGKLQAELSLLTYEEAKLAPVGLGREAPEPLPEPKRPETSFVWFTSPLQSFRFIIWKNHKWLIIKVLLGLFSIFVLFLFINQIPTLLAKVIIDLI